MNTYKGKTVTSKNNCEPDYIKLYTKNWSTFNKIPPDAERLFIQLAIRMTYNNIDIEERDQVVYVIGPVKDQIKKVLGWNSDAMFYKTMKRLVDCGAIKKISRGLYQINPQYCRR